MPPPDAITPSPEMDALVARFAAAVKETTQTELSRSVREIRDHVDEKIDQLREVLDRKIENLRRELKLDIGEVREVQDSQGATLAEHGEAIARMETRLEAGDAKFFDHACRLQKIEGTTQKARVTIAWLAGKAGKYGAVPALAGAVSAGVIAMLNTFGGKVPEKPAQPPVQQSAPQIEKRPEHNTGG